MSPLDDSKLIFQQLAQCDDSVPGLAVRTIIENHDAWSHNVAALVQLNTALRHQLQHAPRPAPLAARLSLQQSRLHSLAISLPQKLPAAG